MTTPFSGGYHYESSEARTLGTIKVEAFDYKDQQKNLIQLNNSVSYMSSYMRKMQKGIDSANENFIQQIQGFINDIVVMLGGGGDTGFDLGDLGYVFKGFSALFGWNTGEGLSKFMPLNWNDAVKHFFDNYIGNQGNFKDKVNDFIDRVIASLLATFGQVPILGQAVEQLAVWLRRFADGIVGGQDKADEAFNNANQAKLAQNLTDFVVDWKAAAGTNLMLSPHFNTASVDRFPSNNTQVSGYAFNEKKHSGLMSWKWTHRNTLDCGISFAPSTRIKHYEVKEDESYFIEAWMYPAAANNTATGSIRIGGTWTDSAGTLTAADVYMDCPLSGPDMVKDQWNKINITLTVPTGFDTAEFWCKSTADGHEGNVFYIDDVTVREDTSGKKLQVQIDSADQISDFKAKAGLNLVLDAKFSLGNLVTRFPFNTNQLYDYSSTQHHSGLVSWKWTQETGASCGIILNPTNKISTFQVEAGDSWYVEGYLRPPDTGTTGVIKVGATFTDSAGLLGPTDVFENWAMTGITKSAWTKVTGSVIVPAGYDTAQFWIVASSAVAGGGVFYVDDLMLKFGTPVLALATATTATNNTQTVIDKIHQAINGGSTTNHTLQSVFDNIKTAWDKAVDARSAATTADGKAVTADGKAVTAAGNIQTIIDNIHQAVNGGSTTGHTLQTVFDNIKIAWDKAVDAKGTGTTAVGNIQTIIDNIHQAVNGGSTTGHTLQTVFDNIKTNWDKAVAAHTRVDSTNTSLFNSTSPATTVQASAVPSLDASKVTTGTFGNALIASGLDAAKLTTGTLPIARIGSGAVVNTYLGSDIAGSKIASAIGAANVPSLDGSKIGSGTIAANFIAALDAAKITTGTLGTGLIPNITKAMSTDIQATIDNIYQAIYGGSSTGNTLASVKTGLTNVPGANIVSAILAAIVPSLDASKVTTGTFGNALIASGLDAAKLTTGTLPIARIGSGAVVNTYLGSDIAGSKIASAIGAAIVPSLDASKITTGTLGTGAIPNITKAMSTDIQATIDNIYQAIYGGATTGNTVASVKTGLTNVPGANIVSAILAAIVPSLDASKITTGTIGNALIASDLDASKLTAGTLPVTRIGAGAILNAYLGSDIAGSKIASAILASIVPSLDATKITTGTLGTGQIPNVTKAMSTDMQATIDNIYQAIYGGVSTGNTVASVKTGLTNVPGANIVSAILASIVPSLDATKITTGTLGTGQIPNLDAAKITTGTFGNALIASGLDATKLTTGTLPIARIAAGAILNTHLGSDLDASKLTAGTLPVTRIGTGAIVNAYLGSDIAGSKIASAILAAIVPSLDASKITTGTLGNALIASGLDAAKITTGTLPAAQVPSLDAAKITTGTFANAMIASGLDAAKLTTGTMPVARIAANAIVNAYLGSDIAGSKIASAILAAIVPALDATKITTGTFGTTMIADAAITGVKTSGLDASKITSGTIATAQLPEALAVGSGYITRRTSGTIGLDVSGSTFTTGMFNTSQYDSTTTFGTDDYSVSTGAGGELRITAINEGWYMVEVGIGLQRTARLVTYQISAALFQGGVPVKFGSSTNYSGANSAQIPFSAQGSWIMYLTNTQIISPGWAIYSTTGLTNGAPIIGVNHNKDTYFSISLLNRSLA